MALKKRVEVRSMKAHDKNAFEQGESSRGVKRHLNNQQKQAFTMQGRPVSPLLKKLKKKKVLSLRMNLIRSSLSTFKLLDYTII